MNNQIFHDLLVIPEGSFLNKNRKDNHRHKGGEIIRKQTNKSTILISLVLLSLSLVFCVSTASADPGIIYVNNATGNDSYNGESAIFDGVNGPKLSIKNATGTVTPNGVVNIADGLYTGTNNTNINIVKSVNIVGQSQANTIIDGENTNWIFKIAETSEPGITVTLSKLTLTNAYSYWDDGSAIWTNCSNLTVSKCSFINNHANNGGAIYNEYGNLTVTHSNFNGNYAENNGGAIYNEYGNLTVTLSAFIDNFADDSCGAIYNEGGNLTVTLSAFIDNRVIDDGGAIYTDNGTLSIVGSTFSNNVANQDGGLYGGGAIYSNNSTLTLMGSNFSNNTAYYNGGAIYSNNSTLTLMGSNFFNNTANQGGAIINYRGTANVTGSTLTNNTATDYGGAIDNEYGTTNITSIILTNNNATYGGAIDNYHGTVNLTSSTLTNNTATYGGAIDNYRGTGNLTNSTLTNNTATNYGGAINNEYGTVNLTSSTLTNNNATYGGAILNTGTANVHFNRIVRNTAIQGSAICNSDEGEGFGLVNATANWWGSNNPDFNNLIFGENVTYTPWLYLTFSSIPTTIPQGSTSTLTANFNNLFDGTTLTTIDPSIGHLPDGTPVTFTTNLGNVGSKSIIIDTLNGIATAILRGDEGAGVALTSVSLDSQTLYATVTITAAESATSNNQVNAASNTVGMQTTGAPIMPLALAALSVLGGLITTRKNQ
ncbi:MAG: hypothetical protein CIT02_07050 [Methanobacterium sp. BAmetb5]|nr:MAG: hypothetical protein CIT02_07050 [Methanobacterium sp. BAmetb5]